MKWLMAIPVWSTPRDSLNRFNLVFSRCPYEESPFAALDFLTRAELQSQLLQIQARMPRTIVLVTHQLDEAILLAQKIVVMHSDSSLWECSLADNAYPRDVDEPQMRELKQRITEECRK